MHRAAAPLPLLVTLAAARCGPGPAPSADPPSTAQAVTQDARLHTSVVSDFAEPAELAITSEAEWRAAWERLTRPTLPPPPLPSVDFAREIVVLVAAGGRSTGGWGVSIDSLAPQPDGALVVTYTVRGPGPECMSAQVMTAPVDVVRAARPAGAVRFVGRTVQTPC